MSINVDLEELKKLQLNNIIDLLEAKKDDEEEGEEPESSEEEGDEESEEEVKESSEIVDAFNLIFEGQEVDQEFITKAKDAFKVAAEAKAKSLLESKLADLEKTIEARLAEKQEETDKQIDAYLNYVVEEWLKENEVAVESNHKAQQFDSLMESLKEVFGKFNVTEEEAAQISESEAKVKALETELAEMAVKLQESKDEIKKQDFRNAIAEITADLAESEAAKFEEIIGELDVDLQESVEGFKGRLESLKKIFVKKADAAEEVVTESEEVQDEVIAEKTEEVVTESATEATKQVGEKMETYLKSVRRGFVSR